MPRQRYRLFRGGIKHSLHTLDLTMQRNKLKQTGAIERFLA
jgi:hypothetical protein